MNPEIKAIWVAALRSKKYSQCKGVLHIEGDGFCCLGVLADLMEPKWDKNEVAPNSPHMGYRDARAGGLQYILLPLEVALWAGLSTGNLEIRIPSRRDLLPIAISKDNARSLTEMNDAGATFEEIADLIEKEF